MERDIFYAKDCEHLLDNGIICDLFSPNSCAYFHTKVWRIDVDHRCRYYKQNEKKVITIKPVVIKETPDNPLPKSTIYNLFGE